jgi:hypothetical protein
VNTIFLVEDSERDELLLKRVLESAGLVNPVMVVRSSEEAIEHLKEPIKSISFQISVGCPEFCFWIWPFQVRMDFRFKDGFEVLNGRNINHILRDF